jgi:hypothetical protein
MTLEQKKALALAAARARAAGQAAPGPAAPAQTAPDAPEAFQRAGGHGPLAAGAAQAVIRAYLGLKQFGGGLSEEEQAVLAEIKKEDEADPNGGWRTAGDIGANIAMTAIPGGAVAKTAVLPKMAAKIAARSGSRLGAVGAGAATSGAQSFLLTPGEGESFGEQMADKARRATEDAALGGGLAAGGKLLKKAITKPFEPSVRAEKLFAQGVNPTLQQGAEGTVGKFVGGLTSGAAKIKQRQDREVLASFVKQYIDPNIDVNDMPVSDMVGLLEGLLSSQKAAITAGKTFTLKPADRQRIIAAVRGPQGTDPMSAAKALSKFPRAGAAMQSNNVVRMKSHRMEKYRNRFQDIIDGLPNDTDLGREAQQNWIKAKQRFEELVRDPSLSPEELASLKQVNERFSNFSRLRDAADNPSFHKNPRMEQLLAEFANRSKQTGSHDFARGADPAVKDLLEPAVEMIGETPTQDASRSALIALRRSVEVPAKALGAAGVLGTAGVLGGAPAAAMASIPYALSLAGQTPTGARVLLGQTAAQKKLAEQLRRMGPYLAPSGFVLSPEEE